MWQNASYHMQLKANVPPKKSKTEIPVKVMLLLLSRFSRVRLCATP